jgi:hypothetical protein
MTGIEIAEAVVGFLIFSFVLAILIGKFIRGPKRK